MPLDLGCDFPGGNIVVERVAGDEVRLHQDLRDTTCDWFYWCCRVRGAQGRTVQFTFTKSRALGVRGPAVSLDEGQTWRWLGTDSVHDNSFVFRFPHDVPAVRLSFAMPYQVAHWQHFVRGLRTTSAFSLHPLCTTRAGGRADYMLAGCQAANPCHRIVITCRHHCCEMMASYAVEGLVAWLVDSDDAAADWLRDHVQLLVVPFVDMDGVEAGDQGKNRHPRDHNRDYEGASLYSATAAIRALLPEWGGGRMRVALDLHCPHIAGPHNEVIYLVGSREQHNAAEQLAFSALLESMARGPLPLCAADFLPFGRAWNTGGNFAGGRSFSAWAATLPGVQLATSIELPYANVRGVEVNQGSAREFGVDLARALCGYVRR